MVVTSDGFGAVVVVVSVVCELRDSVVRTLDAVVVVVITVFFVEVCGGTVFCGFITDTSAVIFADAVVFTVSVTSEDCVVTLEVVTVSDDAVV